MFANIPEELLEAFWRGLSTPQQQQFKTMVSLEVTFVKDSIISMPNDLPAEQYKAAMTAKQDSYSKLNNLLQLLNKFNSEQPSSVSIT